MSSSVHYPITLGQDWIRVEQVWYPPRLQRTVDCDGIADAKPPKEPPWKGTLKVDGASSQSESIRSPFVSLVILWPWTPNSAMEQRPLQFEGQLSEQGWIGRYTSIGDFRMRVVAMSGEIWDTILQVRF